MLGRTVFAATLFALAQFAVASPPGCLLGAANQYNNPADIKSICQSKNLKEMVAKICGDDVDAAMAALADICNEQNVSIASAVSSATAPLTATGSSPKSTGTGGSTMVPMYPTASGSSSGGHSSGNGTIATGTPKPFPSPSATGTARVPGQSGAAGKAEFGLAAVAAGFMVAVL